jgi:hypothetical protein
MRSNLEKVNKSILYFGIENVNRVLSSEFTQRVKFIESLRERNSGWHVLHGLNPNSEASE